MVLAGCGSAQQDGKTPTSAAVAPAAPDEVSGSSTHVQAEPKTSKITVAAPTDEQIKRWTPTPFERIELLAIREWEKTSFTGRVAATPDGQHFIVAGSRVLLWSIAKEEPEHVFLELPPNDSERVILSLAISPDGRWFAVGDSKGMVRIWNLDDRQELVAKQLGSTGIQWLAISTDAQEIATISYDSEVKIWNAATLEPQNKFKVNTNGVKRIEFTAPQMLAVAGESTSLWNTSTGAMVQELSPGRYSFALGRSPDASRFIYGSKDSLRIWNIAESKQEAEITRSVSGSELLAFSPDGKYLATTNGRSIQLWNLAERRVVQMIDSFGWAIVGVSWLPKTNLLVVASDIGCTRIWGTVSQGTALGLKPLHAAMTEVQSPATSTQMEQLIDLRTFPMLPGSEPSSLSQGDFNGVAPVAIDEANSFYKYFLEKDGWKQTETPSANPAAIEYRKNGFTISVQCFDAGGGKTNIMVQNSGNYDLRQTPKFDAAPVETMYEAANSVSYRTTSDLLRIETTLLRKLQAAGWTAYSRLKSSHSERPDERDLKFLKNGATLQVSIGKSPDDPAKFNIQYSLFSNFASVPIPQDSGYVEFDGSTEPALVATTRLTLDQAREFYDKELTSQGWLVRKLERSMKEDHGWLSYLRGQSDLGVSLSKLPNGRTLVRIGNAPGSIWDLSQKKEDSGAKSADGLEAADFPVLKASVAYDANDKSIEVTIAKSTLAMAADQFAKALEMLGWMPEEGGIRGEDYTLLRFHKGKKEITLRARPKDGNAVLNFQGDGLVWKKELPAGKQIISFESWLRQNKQPPGLEQLDRYETEMRALQTQQPKG